MDMNKALAVLEDSRSENFSELDWLLDIKRECESDSRFAGALANAAGFDNSNLLIGYMLLVVDRVQTRLMPTMLAKRTESQLPEDLDDFYPSDLVS